MIAVCPLCGESVTVCFDEKNLGDTCVPVWHFSRSGDHHCELDSKSSANLRDEYNKAQAMSKKRATPTRRSY
jgi:hypothetical protein